MHFENRVPRKRFQRRTQSQPKTRPLPPGQAVVIQESWIRPLLEAIQGNVVTDTLRKLFAVARDAAERQ
jgi:hypothetical protein